MRTGRPLLLQRLLPMALTIALLAGCSQHDDDKAPPSTGVATQVQQDTASTADCEGNPLVRAMPPRTTIGGLPFRKWECTFNTFHAVYGSENGREVDIALTDTRSPDIDKQPAMQTLYRRTFDTQRATTQATVQILMGTVEGYKANAELLPIIGGPDYVPVAETSATGDPVIIQIGHKDEQAPAEVVALFKARHVFTMEARDHGTTITGLNGPQARAIFDPFIQQLHPQFLP